MQGNEIDRNDDGQMVLERELARRLKLEKLLINVSSKAMSSVAPSDFQQACLDALGTTLEVSRVYIFEHRHATDTMDNTFEWTNSGIEPKKERLQGIAADAVPWWIEQMKDGQLINFEDIERIPSEPEKVLLRQQQIASILVV
ncbi:MAG: hypothetical protein KFF50_09130, partial [Desulfatitalea sp.]|nr:hypothetical protein [Desulfatitalea sp.]